MFTTVLGSSSALHMRRARAHIYSAALWLSLMTVTETISSQQDPFDRFSCDLWFGDLVCLD